ncbi:hypothetical protein J6590_048538 [Homalodisca vitripennis]|nr:hypothetical protein J6590_048538 [Homalodisca vitripennis]
MAEILLFLSSEQASEASQQQGPNHRPEESTVSIHLLSSRRALNMVTVPVISEKECKRWVYDVVKSQICAKGDNGKDSCTGDSGGPLMGRVAKPNGIGYFSVLIGITSFGESKKTRVGHVLCGDHIGVYVRVSEYIQWILNNIRE